MIRSNMITWYVHISELQQAITYLSIIHHVGIYADTLYNREFNMDPIHCYVNLL